MSLRERSNDESARDRLALAQTTNDLTEALSVVEALRAQLEAVKNERDLAVRQAEDCLVRARDAERAHLHAVDAAGRHRDEAERLREALEAAYSHLTDGEGLGPDYDPETVYLAREVIGAALNGPSPTTEGADAP
jgi:hypothetical protein